MTEQYRVIRNTRDSRSAGRRHRAEARGDRHRGHRGIVLLMLGAIRANVAHRDTPAHVAVLIAVAAIAVAYLFALAQRRRTSPRTEAREYAPQAMSTPTNQDVVEAANRVAGPRQRRSAPICAHRRHRGAPGPRLSDRRCRRLVHGCTGRRPTRPVRSRLARLIPAASLHVVPGWRAPVRAREPLPGLAWSWKWTHGRDQRRERRRLAEIETVLRRQDPAFVQRFEKRRLTPRSRRILARLAILLVLAVTAVAVAIGLWRYAQGHRDDGDDPLAPPHPPKPLRRRTLAHWNC